MAIDLPGGLFEQTDVRETSTESFAQSNFNPSDFLVAEDTVNLANKTSYWSASGAAFHPHEFNTGNNGADYQNGAQTGNAQSTDNATQFFCPVNLPHGTVVTAAVCHATMAGETWTLQRKTLDGGAIANMASGSFGNTDTSISNATIDNSLYCYQIETSSLDLNDEIESASITYTTDYD